MSIDEISRTIKAEAFRLGFSAVGFAEAAPVEAYVADGYRRWIAEGRQGEMAYLENNLDKRLDPTLLMPSARSIISLALNYYPRRRLSSSQYQFAYYAYGKDYHDVIKMKLQELVEHINQSVQLDSAPTFKLCVDTVPILERYWAVKAGLGWIGKNTNLIIPHAGSFFFLAEIITDLELSYNTPLPSHCGKCTRCIEACPQHALSPYSLDAGKCLSYLTIEHRGEWDTNVSDSTPYIYGCDCCQLACPYNNHATPTVIPELEPSEAFLSMRPSDWHNLSVEQYRTLFKGSAVKRAKYDGLLRNINSKKSSEQ